MSGLLLPNFGPYLHVYTVRLLRCMNRRLSLTQAWVYHPGLLALNHCDAGHHVIPNQFIDKFKTVKLLHSSVAAHAYRALRSL